MRKMGVYLSNDRLTNMGVKSNMKYFEGNTLILSALLMSLLTANGLSQQPQTRPPLTDNENPLLIGKRNINQQQINFYSVEKEQALGNRLAAEFEQTSRIVEGSVVTAYLTGLVRNLTLHSDATVPISIKVVNSEEVNAFALPGGFLYVNLGLMRAVETEAELVAVVSHLIAHVAARHGIEMASKAELLIMASYQHIYFADWIGVNLNYTLPLGLLSFARKNEFEADVLAAQYSWAAGYDPTGLIKFYEKSSQSPASNAPSSFNPHPQPLVRISKLKELIALFPVRENLIATTEEFNRMKASLPAEPSNNPQLRRN
jgi:beta-barrel assembly-enhancing protease